MPDIVLPSTQTEFIVSTPDPGSDNNHPRLWPRELVTEVESVSHSSQESENGYRALRHTLLSEANDKLGNCSLVLGHACMPMHTRRSFKDPSGQGRASDGRARTCDSRTNFVISDALSYITYG